MGTGNRSPRLAAVVGLFVGALAGVAVAMAGAAIARSLAAAAESEPLIEATHLPPLLTVREQPVELRYDIYCSQPGENPEAGGCDARGTVFVRAGDAGPFTQVPLRFDSKAVEGRYAARIPDDIAASPSGFSYYAVLESNESGAKVTVPEGGATAPERSLPLNRAVDIRLGSHTFGGARRASARVVEATWGEGPGQVGLEQGRSLPAIGGAAFDVERDGTVSVLDEAHTSLLRWRAGGATRSRVPLRINGTIADLAVAADGTIYVLESTASGRSPLLRTFGADGREKAAVEIAERTASQVRMGPNGPVVLQYPSSQWMPAALGGRPLTRSSQLAAARSGRPLPGGGEVIVSRSGNEVRVALAGPNGARRSWRITSETPIGEVQLAEPLGDRLVLVTRVYADERAEFLVLVLDANGVAERFSVDAADWAETAPLSRFRLVSSSLYQLGSTPAGLFVNRYDLEVK